jgi:multiple sugar transport system permease protein
MGMTKERRVALAGCLFLLPNLLGFLVFTMIPVLASLALSFFNWDLFTPPKFVGFHNFSALMKDRAFWYYGFNTVFLMLAIPANMMGALFLAVVMNQKLRGIVVFRTIYFLPTIVAGVGTYLLWRWIFNPDYGLINTMLRAVGIEGPKWLQSIAWAKPALMLMGFWTAVGGNNMILYLAALQGVSPELYEAADIDGANKWQKFWRITWPMVGPTTFFILTMSLIGGFQGGFEQAMVMTGGGPAGATTTISYYIYNHAFLWNHMGYASAIAWVLFAVVFLGTLLNWRFGGHVVHY